MEHTHTHKQTQTNLERGLKVVLVALGEEFIGVGRGPVLVEVLQVLQVGSEVLLTVATGACEDELGIQLHERRVTSFRSFHHLESTTFFCSLTTVKKIMSWYLCPTISYLEKTKDDSLVGFRQDREALLIG